MWKPKNVAVHHKKTQISPGISSVWWESSLSTWRKSRSSYPLSVQWRLIRVGRCPGWSEFARHTLILLVLSCYGSYDLVTWVAVFHLCLLLAKFRWNRMIYMSDANCRFSGHHSYFRQSFNVLMCDWVYIKEINFVFGMFMECWIKKGFTLTLQETRSIHHSMNIPKIELIAYIYIWL